jgi:peptidoglycan/LPS O-acetylase OafA/YrhL
LAHRANALDGRHFSVALFFTISGYVLPRRLISLLHAGRHADFVEALHSSVVRRPFRLLLPVVWSTLAVVVVSYIPTSAMKREDSMLLQLVAWVRETGRYLYFFSDGYHAVNQHTWSLLVEMRSSMSLFVWLFALSRMRHKMRLFLTLALIWYLTVAVPAAQMATFFAGMVTAELDLIASGSLQMRLPWDGLVQAVGKHSLMRVLVSHAVLVTSLYLGSSPSGSSVDSSRDEVLGQCRGWMTLEWLIPEAYPHGGDDPSWLWFWLFWAAWVFLLAVKEINWLKRALSCGFSQCTWLPTARLFPTFLR